jgi:hypothetical protein
MGKKRVFGLAGLFLAGAALSGCQSNRAGGYCQNGSCTPYGSNAIAQNQNPSWNTRPSAPASQGMGAQGYADGQTGMGYPSANRTTTPGRMGDTTGAWDTAGMSGLNSPSRAVTPASYGGTGGSTVTPPSMPTSSTTNSSPAGVPPLSFGSGSAAGAASMSASGRASTYSDDRPVMDTTSGVRSGSGMDTVQPPAGTQSGSSMRMNDTVAPASSQQFGETR